MWEIINDAGWPIWPLIFTSVIGFAIILERLFSLRDSIIVPSQLLPDLEVQIKVGVIKKEEIERLGKNSLAGLMMATVIKNQGKSLEVLNDAVIKIGDSISHKLEKKSSHFGHDFYGRPVTWLVWNNCGYGRTV